MTAFALRPLHEKKSQGERLFYEHAKGKGGGNVLEERKLLGIKDSGVAQPIDGLNDHVGVTDDLAIVIGLLGSTKVVSVGVDEGTGLDVLDSHFNGKVLVRGDGVEVL